MVVQWWFSDGSVVVQWWFSGGSVGGCLTLLVLLGMMVVVVEVVGGLCKAVHTAGPKWFPGAPLLSRWRGWEAAVWEG